MKATNFIAYGVRIYSAEALPLPSMEDGEADHCIKLLIQENRPSSDHSFQFQVPTVSMHGREVSLSSNLPVNEDRTNRHRQWKFDVARQFSMVWSNQSEEVVVYSKGTADKQVIVFWLLHTVIPAYLMLKQHSFFLHASCVAVDNEAVLFLAPSFGGKSTMVDFFVRQGFQLLSDDKTRVIPGEKEYRVFPSHPYRRPYRKLEVLGEYSAHHGKQSLPINSIFILDLVDLQENISISELSGLEKFECFKTAFLYEPASQTQLEIRAILEMVQHYQIYRVTIPKGLEHLPEVLESILSHIKKQS